MWQHHSTMSTQSVLSITQRNQVMQLGVDTSRSSVSMRSERCMRKASRRAGLHQKGCCMMPFMLGRLAGCAASMALINSSASGKCPTSFKLNLPCIMIAHTYYSRIEHERCAAVSGHPNPSAASGRKHQRHVSDTDRGTDRQAGSLDRQSPELLQVLAT